MGRKSRHHSHRRSSSVSSASSAGTVSSDDDASHDRHRRPASSKHSRRRRSSKEYRVSSPISRHRRHRSSGSGPSRYAPTPSVPQTASRPPKIAMVLLLGPDEVEFTLTEPQILYDSPNDLTSTYYADNGGEAKTYRMPDRDAAIFEIIHRYMNKEQVIPIRRSMCPRYLSLEATERKLAEEAKFYRFSKLCALLPPVPAEPRDMSPLPLTAAPAPSVQLPVQPNFDPVTGQMLAPLQPSYAGQPAIDRYQYAQQGITMSDSRPGSVLSQASLSRARGNEANTHSLRPSHPVLASSAASLAESTNTLQPPASARSQASRSSSRSRASSRTNASSIAETIPRDAPRDRSRSREVHPRSDDNHRAKDGADDRDGHRESAERRPKPSTKTDEGKKSSKEVAKIVVDPPASPIQPQNVFAYIYRPGGLRRGEKPFPIIDYPDLSPLPHLFVKATNAEIRFSAFRNAEDNSLFELRYSIRVIDEPATRALAFRANDTTIKAVDSHLRLNGALSDIECRDIPIQIKHGAVSSGDVGLGPAGGSSPADEKGVHTTGFDELLDMMTSKGYVKWPRIWQDTVTNITPVDSLHQRVCLPICEILFDVEFPEEAAAVSEQVGGRGLTLNAAEEGDLVVRNYRVTLHSVKTETRKMRRLLELEAVDGPAKEPSAEEVAAILASRYTKATAAALEPFSAPMQRRDNRASASFFHRGDAHHALHKRVPSRGDVSYRHTRPTPSSNTRDQYRSPDLRNLRAVMQVDTDDASSYMSDRPASDSGYSSGRNTSQDRAYRRARSAEPSSRYQGLRVDDDELLSTFPTEDDDDLSTIGPSASQRGVDDQASSHYSSDHQSSRSSRRREKTPRPVSEQPSFLIEAHMPDAEPQSKRETYENEGERSGYRNLASQMRSGIRPPERQQGATSREDGDRARHHEPSSSPQRHSQHADRQRTDSDRKPPSHSKAITGPKSPRTPYESRSRPASPTSRYTRGESASYYGSILRDESTYSCDAASSRSRSERDVRRETYQTYHSAPGLRVPYPDDDAASVADTELTEAEKIKARAMNKWTR